MIASTQDRVVVRPSDEMETMTDGGLYIPDIAQEPPAEGEIIFVGPGKVSELTGELIPIRHVVGEKVLYGKYAGTEIQHEGETLLLLTERDIMAVITTQDAAEPRQGNGDRRDHQRETDSPEQAVHLEDLR